MSGPKRKKRRYSFDQLLKLVRRLRGEGGCPWDREQNLDTLRQYLIEETYEVLDAIDSNDPAGHAEELGDLLLQILLQAEIRRENGDFTFADVAHILASKLVRRHPHVFGNVKVSGSKDVVRNWETIKSGERRNTNRRSTEYRAVFRPCTGRRRCRRAPRGSDLTGPDSPT